MSAEAFAFLLFLIISVISFELADGLVDNEEAGQLTKTLYAALLEELNGAHLRVAATNVSSAKTCYLCKILSS